MNPNVKGLTIGVGTGVATYVGDIVLYLIEMGSGDLPPNIDSAVTGLTVAVVGYLIYWFLPASPAPTPTPTPTE